MPSGCAQKISSQHFYGQYLGQNPPKAVPIIFAKGIVKNCISFTPDGNECYFRGNTPGKIMFMKLIKDNWTTPQVVPFSINSANDMNPHLSPDGNTLAFASNRSNINEGNNKNSVDIFVAVRTANGWEQPKYPGDCINSKDTDGHPTLSSNGNLYFFSNRNGDNDIFYSKLVNRQYAEPRIMCKAINSDYDEVDPLIAADESFIIFCVRDKSDGFGKNDLYISFQNKDGTWTQAKNMGNKINTAAEELFPGISPDGKYLFFTSSRKGNYYTYWMDTKIINNLKSNIMR